MTVQPYRIKYGAWSGNPSGDSADFTRCCEAVYPNERGIAPIARQCFRKRGFGPENAYCKQHSPASKALKAAAASDRWKKEMQDAILRSAAPKFLSVLRQISEGHNDPRTLAYETVKEFLE